MTFPLNTDQPYVPLTLVPRGKYIRIQAKSGDDSKDGAIAITRGYCRNRENRRWYGWREVKFAEGPREGEIIEMYPLAMVRLVEKEEA